MSCLMEALEDKRVRLQPECKKRLNDRIEMWSYAAKVRRGLGEDLWSMIGGNIWDEAVQAGGRYPVGLCAAGPSLTRPLC